MTNKLLTSDVKKFLKTASIQCAFEGNFNNNKQLLFRGNTFIVMNIVNGKVYTKKTFRILDKAVCEYNRIYLF
jgi:hypothetical protein